MNTSSLSVTSFGPDEPCAPGDIGIIVYVGDDWFLFNQRGSVFSSISKRDPQAVIKGGDLLSLGFRQVALVEWHEQNKLLCSMEEDAAAIENYVRGEMEGAVIMAIKSNDNAERVALLKAAFVAATSKK